MKVRALLISEQVEEVVGTINQLVVSMCNGPLLYKKRKTICAFWMFWLLTS